MRNFIVAFLFSVAVFLSVGAAAFADSSEVTIYFFGRDDCTHCEAEKAFLNGYTHENSSVRFEYKNVLKDQQASALFATLVKKHDLPQVTPLTIIGANVIQGFDTAETTGLKINDLVEQARSSDIRTLEEHILRAEKQSNSFIGTGCDKNGTSCDSITNPNAFVFKLPMFGVVDLKTFSLFSLSAILGTVDGFNPCAMWVLITFLVLLSQTGSRKKMILVAGVFVIAETVMYNLILNVWFTTWDFVGLDAIVTPLVGLLGLGGGVFFLYRYYKNRNRALVCDISDLDSQHATTQKVRDLITQPTTIVTILGIIAVAFSVNIIEFACSVGIPQAYTKILELNDLNFFSRQFYIMIYTIGYMIDDVIVFALAIWGFTKLESHGHYYAQLSLLIGGVLMLLLGGLLIFNPSLLVL